MRGSARNQDHRMRGAHANVDATVSMVGAARCDRYAGDADGADANAAFCAGQTCRGALYRKALLIEVGGKSQACFLLGHRFYASDQAFEIGVALTSQLLRQDALGKARDGGRLKNVGY